MGCCEWCLRPRAFGRPRGFVVHSPICSYERTGIGDGTNGRGGVTCSG